MIFKCQHDSFLKEYVTNVVSCQKSCFKTKDANLEGYDVILQDTILFPEGGGQSCDYGTINDFPVKNVTKVDDQAVHFVQCPIPFEIGSEVKEVLDWTRRLDNMQQHSGQHLISALFEQKFGLNTISWWLGSETSFIEFHSQNICDQYLNDVENIANTLIIEGRRVEVMILTTSEKSMQIENMRHPKGLPNNLHGPIRLINIDGIDSNMCCGTHVTNLSQLQSIKLLNIEKTKKGSLVHFIVGGRILKKLTTCYNRELEMTKILKSEPGSHVSLVNASQIQHKDTLKLYRKLILDLAAHEGKIFNDIKPSPKFYSLHKEYGLNSNFLHTFLRYINSDSSTLFFLSVGDGTGLGHILIKGLASDVEILSKRFVEILSGKGNSRDPTCFQAKVNCLSKVSACEILLADHFK